MTTAAPRFRVLGGRAIATVGAFVLAATLLQAAPVQAASSTVVTINAGSTDIRAHEAAYVSGTVKVNDKAVKNATVTVQYRIGSVWHSLYTRKTSASGAYHVLVYRDKGTTLRTVVSASSSVAKTASPSLALHLVTTSQTFEQKAESFAKLLGATVSGLGTGKTAGGTPIRWQRFTGGTLVEIGTGQGDVKSWIVPAEFGESYRSVFGAQGKKLGAPLGDVECGLLDGGCIQRFQKGVIYRNPKGIATHTPHITYGNKVSAELTAVGKTQVGFVEGKKLRYNKYTAWNGNRVAWCGMFWSWASAASGNYGAVPNSANFDALKAAVKKRGVTKTPAVGSIAFMAFWGNSVTTHSGMVMSINKDGSINTLEANLTIAAGTHAIVYKTRPASMIKFYYVPGT